MWDQIRKDDYTLFFITGKSWNIFKTSVIFIRQNIINIFSAKEYMLNIATSSQTSASLLIETYEHIII